MRVIVRIAVGTSGQRTDRDRPEDRRADTAVSSTRRNSDREPGDVGLDLVPGLAPRRARRRPASRDPDARREHRLGDVADRERAGLEDRAYEMPSAVGQRQPDERARSQRVPDRRPLAGEVRQEDDAVAIRPGRSPPPRGAPRS